MKSFVTITVAAMVLMVLASAGPAASMPGALVPVAVTMAWRSVPTALALTTQRIIFVGLSNKTLGAAPFTVAAIASSGLPVSFASTATQVCTVNGSTVTLVGAGTCRIRASQAGNATYAAAPSVDQSFTVAKGNQSINFAPLADRPFGTPPFVVTATATSGLAVTFATITPAVCAASGATVTILSPGTCVIRAAQTGDANYNAAPSVDRSFAVASDANVTIQYTYDAVGNLIGVQRAQ